MQLFGRGMLHVKKRTILRGISATGLLFAALAPNRIDKQWKRINRTPWVSNPLLTLAKQIPIKGGMET
jgi:hypothetical protein